MYEINDMVKKLETHYTHTRKVWHCKTCSAKCDKEPPIVGCESIMVLIPPLEVKGKVYGSECIKRTWFDKNYFPVEFWRSPTEEEFRTLSRKEWEAKLAEELKKAQAEATKHE